MVGAECEETCSSFTEMLSDHNALYYVCEMHALHRFSINLIRLQSWANAFRSHKNTRIGPNQNILKFNGLTRRSKGPLSRQQRSSWSAFLDIGIFHLFCLLLCCSVACYFDCTVVYKSKLWVAEWQTGSSTDVCPLYALGLLTIGEYQWNWFTVSTLLRPVNWPLEARWKWTVNHSCAVHPYCMLAFQASAMEIWSDVSGSAATTNRLNTMQPLTVKPLQIDTL